MINNDNFEIILKNAKQRAPMQLWLTYWFITYLNYTLKKIIIIKVGTKNVIRNGILIRWFVSL